MSVEKPRDLPCNFGMAGVSRDEVAWRLRVIRKAFDLSQESAGEIGGIGKTGWSNYESMGQDRLIEVLLAARLCDRYGVTLDWIYRGLAFGVPDAIMQKLDNAEKSLLAEIGGRRPRRRPVQAAKARRVQS